MEAHQCVRVRYRHKEFKEKENQCLQESERSDEKLIAKKFHYKEKHFESVK